MKKVLKYCVNTSEWTPTRSEWTNLISSLPKTERDRIDRYSFKRDAKNSLIGQILLRISVKRLLPKVEWINIIIERNSKDRPCLKLSETLRLSKIGDFGSHQIDFNLSHSQDLCTVVAGVRQLKDDSSLWLGVDCMKIEVDRTSSDDKLTNDELYAKEMSKHERVIRTKFSASEKEFINSRPNSVEKLASFYRLWCLKESYIKATGVGLVGLDESKLEFRISSDLMIDPTKKRNLIAEDTQLRVDSKVKSECKFYEQYFIPSGKHQHVDLHVVTTCLIDTDKVGGDKWENLRDEFVELSFKDVFDEVVKSNGKFEENVNVNLFKGIEESWTKFNQNM